MASNGERLDSWKAIARYLSRDIRSVQRWERERGLYQPLARTCVGTAAACLALGAIRPTPLVLCLVLVLLLSIPWVLAVARRLASGDDAPLG